MVDPSEWDLLAIDVLDVPFDRSVQILVMGTIHNGCTAFALFPDSMIHVLWQSYESYDVRIFG